MVLTKNRPTKVRLVLDRANSGWIIGKFATRLLEYLPNWGFEAEIAEKPSHTADINHSMIYHYVYPERYKHSTVFITHVDDPLKLKLLREDLTHRVDVGICMSRMSMDDLVKQGVDRRKLCFITPAHDAVMTPRRIVIGITSRVYSDGRKREDLLVKLASSMRLDAFHFEIIGAGWDEVIDHLERAGATVRFYPGSTDYERDYAVICERVPTFDYYLYTGLDEGSMGLLDALAVGAKSIVTPQGFHLDIKEGITYSFWNFEQLREVFLGLASERQSRMGGVSGLTWNEYARRHAIVWDALLEGKPIAFADLFTAPEASSTSPVLRPSFIDLAVEKVKFLARIGVRERRSAYRYYRDLRKPPSATSPNGIHRAEPIVHSSPNPKSLPAITGRRIVFVIDSLRTSASFRAIVQLAHSLRQERGAQVQLWALSGAPGVASRLCDDHEIRWRIELINWGRSRFKKWKSILAFARKLRVARPDVILSHGTFPSILCGLIWKRVGAQNCISSHPGAEAAAAGGKLQGLAYRRIPQFVANSQPQALSLAQDRAIPSARIRVIPPAIKDASVAVDRAAARERLNLDRNPFVACSLTEASLSDYSTLLKAWRMVVNKSEASPHPPMLVLAGMSETIIRHLKVLGFELDLGKSLKLMGEIHDTETMLAAADLGLALSTADGLEIVEYMAAKLAVVGWDGIEIRNLLHEKNTRHLTPPGDAAKLAESIHQLATAPDVRRELGEANQKKSVAEFRAERRTAEFIQLMGMDPRQPKAAAEPPPRPAAAGQHGPSEREINAKCDLPIKAGSNTDVR